MKLICLGSSSAGNGYILKGKTSCLIIEAGVSFMEVKKVLNFDISKINGLIYTHIHFDHSFHVKEYLAAGIPCYSTPETIAGINQYIYNAHPIKSAQAYKIGEFKVIPFTMKHDVECFGYLIRHPEMGQLVFITDSQYSPFRFPGTNHWMIEANYDQDILDRAVLNGGLLPVVRKRIMNSHISLQTAKELLKANDLTETMNIVLLHLSNGNSDAKRFKQEVERLTGKPTYIADKGLEIDLNLNPF